MMPDVPNEKTLPLAGEQLHVERRSEITGRVRVRTVTEEHPKQFSVDLSGEKVDRKSVV